MSFSPSDIHTPTFSTASPYHAPSSSSSSDRKEIDLRIVGVALNSISTDEQTSTFNAHVIVEIKDPITKEKGKFVITIDDVRFNPGDEQKTIDWAAEQVLDPNDDIRAIIELGLTHLTPKSTTKAVHYDKENDKFSVDKEKVENRKYLTDSKNIITERSGEVFPKYHLWNNINTIIDSDKQTLPQELQVIKEKLPNGPLDKSDLDLILKHRVIDSKWCKYNEVEFRWYDTETDEQLDTFEPYHKLDENHKKTITNLELENVKKKVEKWKHKYEITDYFLKNRVTRFYVPPGPMLQSKEMQPQTPVWQNGQLSAALPKIIRTSSALLQVQSSSNKARVKANLDEAVKKVEEQTQKLLDMVNSLPQTHPIVMEKADQPKT